MKILTIRLANLNSLKGEYTVDFTRSPLSDTGLFLITGETGSGKTTLLDALTLALYGRVARGCDGWQLMTHGTAECWAEVTFRCQGQDYRAKWATRRARNKVDGKLMDSTRELALLSPQGEVIQAEKKTAVDAAILAITQLDYQQFTRSVLLAQGQFAAFLSAKKNERGDLLEKITGTTVYSQLSKAAHQRAKAKREDLQALQQGLEHYQLLEPDAQQGYQAKKNQLNQSIVKAQQAQAANQKLASQAEGLDREIDSHQKQIEQNQQQIEQNQHLIEQHRQTSQQTAQQKQALQQQQQALQAWLATHQRDGLLIKEFKGLQQQHADWLAMRQKQQALNQEGQTLERDYIVQHRCAMQETELQQKKAHLDEQQQRLAQQLAQGDSSQRRKQLTEIKEILSSLGQLKTLLNQQASLQEAAKELEQKQKEAANEQHCLSEKRQATEHALAQAKEQRDDKQKIHEQALLLEKYAQARAHLQPDTPCPLCGSTEHPYMGQYRPPSFTQEARQQAQQRLDQAQKQRDASVQSCQKNQTEIEVAQEKSEENQSQQQHCVEQQQLLFITTLPMLANKTADESIVQQLWLQYAENYRQAEQELETLEQQQQLFFSEEFKYNQSYNEFQSQKNALKTLHERLENCLKQQKQLKIDLLQREQKLQQELSVYTEDLTEDIELMQRLDQRQREWETHSRTDQQQQMEVKTAEQAYEYQQQQIEHAQKAQQALKRQLKADAETLARTQQQRQQLLTSGELQAQAEEIGQQLIENSRESGRITQILEGDQQARKQVETDTAEIARQNREYQRWQQLDALIGSANGDKFRVFAQSLSLQHLCQSANQHLQQLNPRYLIQHDANEPLEFAIIDRYQADNCRGTKTLSGGESFLVSLALALGLSDLASKNVPIESLFIDEGFGTLDPYTLDTALSSLENLQASGKHIGIISHVSALQERISTQVKLSKQSNGLSVMRLLP